MGITRTRTLVAVGLLAGLGALGPGPVLAASALSAPGTTSTTSPPTTTATTPTTIPPAPTTTTTGPPTSTTTAPTSTTTSSTTSSTTIPPSPGLAAAAASVHRSGPSSTASLLAALGPLARLGLSPEQIAILGFGQFPVAGLASYSDIFLEYRSWPQPHAHQGIDIEAPEGTPLRSPADGTLTYSYSDPSGYGLTALVTQADGTAYLLAHMSATVAGLSSGAEVTQGRVIGFVGETGDATGPHLDFEIHPHGGPAIDAKPILDEYLAAAIAAAPGLIARYEGAPQVQPAPAVPGASFQVTPTVPSGARSRLGASGAGRPIALVGSGPASARWLEALGAALVAALAGSLLWKRRRREPGTWTEP